jgi:hypothetical protein
MCVDLRHTNSCDIHGSHGGEKMDALVFWVETPCGLSNPSSLFCIELAVQF